MKLITEVTETVKPLILEEAGAKHYFVEGPFLQAEIKNRNGRIYPLEILQREAMRYTKEFIKEGRALGELGHPDCGVRPYDTLTEHGWKPLNSIVVGDRVVSRHPTTGVVSLQRVTGVVDEEYKGDVIRISSPKIDISVTPTHRFLIANRDGGTSFVSAETLYHNQNDPAQAHTYIPLRGVGTSYVPHDIQIGRHRLDYQLFCEFLAIWLAEGHVTHRKGRDRGFSVGISQVSSATKIALIDELLRRLPFTFSTHNGRSWRSFDVDLAEFLVSLGKSHEKYVPVNILAQMDGDTAKKFLNWYILGDGRGVLDTTYHKADVFTVSPRLVGNLSTITALAGYVPRITERTPADRNIEGRRILASASRTIYFVKISQRSGLYLDPRFVTIEKLPHVGRKYCITVEHNETFLWKDDAGYTHWTGNSPQINLDRVSHMITELHQSGNSFNGKAKILSTPNGQIVKALIDEGVKLGVSSRGVGSLHSTSQGNVVGEDFYLATAADIVADPSAPNAFVRGIMEGKEWVWDGGVISEQQISDYRRQINHAVKARPSQRRLIESAIFEKFLRDISVNAAMVKRH